MRQILIPLSVCFAFAACADRSGNIANPQDQVPTQGPGDTNTLPDQTVPPNVTDSGGGGGTDPGGGDPGDGTDGTDGGQPVPEPSTLLLVGSGLAAAAMLRRRRRAAS